MSTLSIASLLRLEVALLRAQQSHGHFDTAVHLGRLGGGGVTCTVSRADMPVLDAGTRTDLVARLLEEEAGSGASSVWVTRAGGPEVQDDDLAWLAAASRAFSSLGLRLDGFWTITCNGWLDVRTGGTRTWKRLRLSPRSGRG